MVVRRDRLSEQGLYPFEELIEPDLRASSLSAFELFIELHLIAPAPGLDGFNIHVRCPVDLVVSDEVVRATWEFPVAHGWAKGDRRSIGGEVPLGGAYGKNDLVAAPTRAQVRRRLIALRDVKLAGFELPRHELDEDWFDVINHPRLSPGE